MRVLLILPLAAVLALLADAVGAEPPPQGVGIEERLIRLDEGQRNLEKRFDDVNRRFDDMNRRIDDLRADMNHRFEEVNRRISDLMTFLQILVAVLAAMAVGIFGTLLLMWRRLVKVEADVALLSSQFRLVRTP